MPAVPLRANLVFCTVLSVMFISCYNWRYEAWNWHGYCARKYSIRTTEPSVPSSAFLLSLHNLTKVYKDHECVCQRKHSFLPWMWRYFLQSGYWWCVSYLALMQAGYWPMAVACALHQDLALLPRGDLMEVSEKGVQMHWYIIMILYWRGMSGITVRNVVLSHFSSNWWMY